MEEEQTEFEAPTNPEDEPSINDSPLEVNALKIEVNVPEDITNTVKALAANVFALQEITPTTDNVDKISQMSKILTNEANALSESIKHLSEDLSRAKESFELKKDDVTNFPYHLFLLEIIINKIHMKCECFEPDYNNLVITCTFLDKQPITLYDSTCGKIVNFAKLNVGKSTLFAMTYDRICSINEFEILLEMLKQPPCSHCVTKIAESRMDYTKEFISVREDLCRRWTEDKPKDNIICTASSPLHKNQFYLTCGEHENLEPIGVIEISIRMSFLGKEITTAFSQSPKPQGTSLLLKEDNGISMYSCQKVEMDDGGKVLLDEDVFCQPPTEVIASKDSPTSQTSQLVRCYNMPQGAKQYIPNNGMSKYDEIYTQMNRNELKIRVPKTRRIERTAKYDRISELCTCESNTYNEGEQIQFEMPPDRCNPDKSHNTYSSNLKYTYKGCDRSCEQVKDKRIINVTPTNCPAPITMEKMLYPGKDVFILKIGKKLETKDKKTDLEIELVTPQAPLLKTDSANTAQQCTSSQSLKSKSSGKNKKSKKKDKKKNKAQKGKKGKKK